MEKLLFTSIELSADGPIKPPYAVYFQGGLTWYHAKLGILMSLQKMVDAGQFTSIFHMWITSCSSRRFHGVFNILIHATKSLYFMDWTDFYTNPHPLLRLRLNFIVYIFKKTLNRQKGSYQHEARIQERGSLKWN